MSGHQKSSTRRWRSESVTPTSSPFPCVEQRPGKQCKPQQTESRFLGSTGQRTVARPRNCHRDRTTASWKSVDEEKMALDWAHAAEAWRLHHKVRAQLMWNPQRKRKRRKPRNIWHRDFDTDTKRTGYNRRSCPGQSALETVVDGLSSREGKRLNEKGQWIWRYNCNHTDGQISMWYD